MKLRLYKPAYSQGGVQLLHINLYGMKYNTK